MLIVLLSRICRTLLSHIEAILPWNKRTQLPRSLTETINLSAVWWPNMFLRDGFISDFPVDCLALRYKQIGHNCVWYSQLPDWVSTSNFTSQELKVVMLTHCTTLLRHFKGQT